MRKHIFAATLALALPFAATAQTTPGNANTVPSANITGGMGEGTVSASGAIVNPEADRQLLTNIATALAGDSAIAGASIDVQVVGGRVTLNGSARDTAQAEAAKGIAQGLAGAANVTSNVTTGR